MGRGGGPRGKMRNPAIVASAPAPLARSHPSARLGPGWGDCQPLHAPRLELHPFCSPCLMTVGLVVLPAGRQQGKRTTVVDVQLNSRPGRWRCSTVSVRWLQQRGWQRPETGDPERRLLASRPGRRQPAPALPAVGARASGRPALGLVVRQLLPALAGSRCCSPLLGPWRDWWYGAPRRLDKSNVELG